MPGVRLAIPFSAGDAMPDFAADKKIVGPVHCTIPFSRPYVFDRDGPTYSMLIAYALPLLKSSASDK